MKTNSSDTKTQGDQLALVDAPDRGAQSFGSPKSLTFNEVEAATWSLITEFFNAGIRPGDIVLVQLPNIMEHVITGIALKLLGATIKSVAMRCDSNELSKLAKTHSLKAYISTADFRGESFTCSHQAAFCDGTLILAFGDKEPESAQLIGEAIADIEALDSCQAYVNSRNFGSTEINACAPFPIDLAHHHYRTTS